MKVAIPSKGRSASIRDLSLTLFPDAIVVVDQAEEGAYRQVVPDGRLVLHPGPPALGSLAAIRNWILDNVVAGDGVLVMADDDVSELVSMPGWSPRRYRDPQVVREVLENAAQCCLDAGVGLFGFGQSRHPLHFRPFDPLKLSGWVGSVVGFVGDHGLRYDERLSMHDDMDLSLQALLQHRIIWNDTRWAFVNLRLTNAGGLAAYRSAEHYALERQILRDKWGRYVRFTTKTRDPRRLKRGLTNAGTMMTLVRVPRKRHVGAL